MGFGLLLICAGQVFAAGEGAIEYFTTAVQTAGFAMAIASGFAAIGQGIAVFKAVEAISRQPKAAGNIQTLLIIGLALIESLALYTLVVALIIFFANPLNEEVLKLAGH